MRIRRGFTVIELVIVTLIVGVLVSLLLLGVQAARESSRSVRCIANLKELGIAYQSFATTKQPSRLGLTRYKEGFERSDTRSFQSRLMPYLEHGWIDDSPIPGEFASENFLVEQQYSPRHPIDAQSIPVFICPSDIGVAYGTNYRICTGPTAHSVLQPEINEGGEGPFLGYCELQPKLERGTSNTIAISERLRSQPDQGFRATSDIWFAGIRGVRDTRYFELLGHSALESEPSTAYKSCGHSWFSRLAVYTAYNHVLPPNSRSTSLVANPWGATSRAGLGYSIGASSNHRGGVNALKFDGSVSLQSEAIDLTIWRNLASATAR